MKHLPAVTALLGLVWAGLPASAQQKEVTLFGRKYTVVTESRAQTYKKQGGGTAEVKLPASDGSEGNRKAALYASLDPGGDATKDRLFVACAILEGVPVAHQLYMLQGADANGLFSKDAATITEFFGGAQLSNEGAGRPVAVMHLNDENTGVNKDRNLLLITFTGNDTFRFYDLDSINITGDQGFVDGALLGIEPGADENTPGTNFGSMALGPNKSVVYFGGGSSVAVIDPKKDTFFPVLTDLTEVTASATVPFPYMSIHGVVHYAGNPDSGPAEDRVLASSTQPDGDGDSTEENKLWRVRVTFPTDLTKAGKLQAEVLAPPQELKGTPLHASEGGVYGIAVGREIAPGLRRLYFADWAGNLSTATPVP